MLAALAVLTFGVGSAVAASTLTVAPAMVSEGNGGDSAPVSLTIQRSGPGVAGVWAFLVVREGTALDLGWWS